MSRTVSLSVPADRTNSLIVIFQEVSSSYDRAHYCLSKQLRSFHGKKKNLYKRYSLRKKLKMSSNL